MVSWYRSWAFPRTSVTDCLHREEGARGLPTFATTKGPTNVKADAKRIITESSGFNRQYAYQAVCRIYRTGTDAGSEMREEGRPQAGTVWQGDSPGSDLCRVDRCSREVVAELTIYARNYHPCHRSIS